MSLLPIEDVLPALRRTLTEGRNALLTAAPGAGKTTRVPLALLDAPWIDGKRLLMLEPRRLAARAAAHRMAATLGELRRQRPDVELWLMGERGRLSQDALSRALEAHRVLEHTHVTGLQPAALLAEQLSACHVGLSLHDTGVSGRRGTVSAMLAAGLPVVTASGVETDPCWHTTQGVVLGTSTPRPDPSALTAAVGKLLDEPPHVAQARRDAAVAFYRAHASWEAFARLLEAASDGQWRAANVVRRDEPAAAHG